MATMYTMPTGAPRLTSGWEVVLIKEDEFFFLADNKADDAYHGSHEYQVITNGGDSLVSMKVHGYHGRLTGFGRARPRWSHDCTAHARAVENAFTKSSSETKNYVPYIGPPSGGAPRQRTTAERHHTIEETDHGRMATHPCELFLEMRRDGGAVGEGSPAARVRSTIREVLS
jgi:hypothetical protein